MKGKDMKATEKTWMDRSANELKDKERQGQWEKTTTQKLEPVVS